MTCDAKVCAATQVPNFDKAGAGSITGNTGEKVTVPCDTGYAANDGTTKATCQADGTFTTVTCDAKACAATQVPQSDKAADNSITGTTGEKVGRDL